MKRLSFIFYFVLMAGFASAQGANVTKAEMYANDKKNLSEAVSLIEAATKDEKTSIKPKTWFVRAQVYAAIMEAKDMSLAKQVGSPGKIAMESLDKMKSVDKPNGPFAKKLEEPSVPELGIINIKDRIYNAMFNFGVETQEDKQLSYSTFKELGELFKDTVATKNAAIIAYGAEMYEEAIASYTVLGDNAEYLNPDAYHYMYEIQSKNLENNQKALEVLEKGLKKHPKDLFLMTRFINYYIENNQTNEAIEKLKQAIAIDPKNSSFYWNLAFLYQQTKQEDLALNTYKECIAIDEKSFEGFFGLGSIYYNRGADKLNNLDIKIYNKKDSEEMKDILSNYKNALPYLESAHKLDPKNTQTWSPLMSVYRELGMKDKLDQLNKFIQEQGDE